MMKNDIIIDIMADTLKERDRVRAISELVYDINEYIDDKFKREYTEKYYKWNGNHCLQTSVMICGILSEIDGLNPRVVYCIMSDGKYGNAISYNHAYVEVIDTYSKEENKIIIDMARNDRKKLFVYDKKNKVNTYMNNDCKYEGYDEIFTIGYREVDFRSSLLFENEYFTEKPSFFLFDEIKKKVKKQIKKARQLSKQEDN